MSKKAGRKIKADEGATKAMGNLFDAVQTTGGLGTQIYSHVVHLWNQIDVDQNGSLAETEAKVFLVSLYKCVTHDPYNWKPKLGGQKETVQTWWEFFDQDKDGILSRKEFLNG